MVIGELGCFDFGVRIVGWGGFQGSVCFGCGVYGGLFSLKWGIFWGGGDCFGWCDCLYGVKSRWGKLVGGGVLRMIWCWDGNCGSC